MYKTHPFFGCFQGYKVRLLQRWTQYISYLYERHFEAGAADSKAIVFSLQACPRVPDGPAADHRGAEHGREAPADPARAETPHQVVLTHVWET